MCDTVFGYMNALDVEREGLTVEVRSSQADDLFVVPGDDGVCWRVNQV